MRFLGRGSAAIRATHAKTFELVTDADISARATCVIAVDAAADAQRPVAGPVRITISAGDEAHSLDADANSSWDPSGPAVVRRGPLRLPGTFAINASAAAADLPRSLVAALRTPGAPVEVAVAPRPGQPTLVLYAADAALLVDDRLAAEVAVADAVIADDDDARRLVQAHHRGDVSTDTDGRVLVVATGDLPGRTAATGDRRIVTVGLPPRLAAAAAMPGGTPVTLRAGRDARTALQRTPAEHRLVLDTDRPHLAALLDLAREIRGSATAVVARNYADPILVRIGEALPDFAGSDRLWCCFGPSADEELASAPLDPRFRRTILQLLADGVPTKPVARALATLTGWPLRRAYDAVVALSRP